MEVWDRSHASGLVAVTDAALPGENLSQDEVVACLWDDDDPRVVVAEGDGAGVAAAVIRDRPDGPVAYVQLLAVHPGAQRQGLGRALVDCVRDWAFDDQGATALFVGGGSPYYLWPGVDVTATAALGLFESLGFTAWDDACNMSFSSRHRAPVPPGFALRRALEEHDASAALDFVGRHWGQGSWVAEARRGIEHGSCHIVVDDDGAVVGFGCHSVNRLGWLGPMGTDPERRQSGLGNALLGAIATDVMAAGMDRVEVAWVGPSEFYAKTAGAVLSRSFRGVKLNRPA